MSEKIFFTFIVLLILTLLIFYYFNYRKIDDNSKTLSKEISDPLFIQKNEILNKLNLIEEQTHLLAVAYYLYCKIRELDIEPEIQDKLFNKYGKQLSFPVIYWTKEFGFLNLDYYLLDESISLYLRDKKFKENIELEETERFKYYIQANAKVESEKIINDLLSI